MKSADAPFSRKPRRETIKASLGYILDINTIISFKIHRALRLFH
jgi:hypothetical protein